MSSYLQRLAERSGLVTTEGKTAAPIASERSLETLAPADAAAANPDVPPEATATSGNPDRAVIEPAPAGTVPASLANESDAPAASRPRARERRAAPDVLRNGLNFSNEAAVPEWEILHGSAQQEQYAARTTAARKPPVPISEQAEPHDGNGGEPISAPLSAGSASSGAGAPAETPGQKPRRTQPQATVRRRPPVSWAAPAKNTVIEPAVASETLPGEATQAAVSNRTARFGQASTSFGKALESDISRVPEQTGHAVGSGRHNAAPEGAAGRIEVRIGSVSLEVHQPPPPAAEPRPKPVPAARTGRTGGGGLDRHYLKGW